MKISISFECAIPKTTARQSNEHHACKCDMIHGRLDTISNNIISISKLLDELFIRLKHLERSEKAQTKPE